MSDRDPAAHHDDSANAGSPKQSGVFTVAEVQPLDVSGVRTVMIGTAIWLLAFVGLLPFHGWLEDTERTWWLWTCLTGVGLGLCGIAYCRRRGRSGSES